METAFDFSTENIAGDAMFETQQSDFDLHNVTHSYPGGDDEDADEEDDDKSGDSTDDNPEYDGDVNTAPAVIQPSPKPKYK